MQNNNTFLTKLYHQFHLRLNHHTLILFLFPVQLLPLNLTQMDTHE